MVDRWSESFRSLALGFSRYLVELSIDYSGDEIELLEHLRRLLNEVVTPLLLKILEMSDSTNGVLVQTGSLKRQTQIFADLVKKEDIEMEDLQSRLTNEYPAVMKQVESLKTTIEEIRHSISTDE